MNIVNCMSDECADPPLRQGQRIVQMACGHCYNGHITPTYSDEVVGEWHVKCYREFQLRPQAMPYVCEVCKDPVQHGEEVLYACIGDKPSPGYIRPEDRGDILYLVKHVRCKSK
jgi:hypothetical protein